jgi:hypothetical protein
MVNFYIISSYYGKVKRLRQCYKTSYYGQFVILTHKDKSQKLAAYPTEGKVSPVLNQLCTIPQRHLEE